MPHTPLHRDFCAIRAAVDEARAIADEIERDSALGAVRDELIHVLATAIGQAASSETDQLCLALADPAERIDFVMAATSISIDLLDRAFGIVDAFDGRNWISFDRDVRRLEITILTAEFEKE